MSIIGYFLKYISSTKKRAEHACDVIRRMRTRTRKAQDSEEPTSSLKNLELGPTKM